ncbi:hypothetical protein [Phyllobacterium bourgognense]|nr:hypothetical protein [Phyllobacterium bourgognense]
MIRIEHHLLAFALVGPGKHHPAVTETDMGMLALLVETCIARLTRPIGADAALARERTASTISESVAMG